MTTTKSGLLAQDIMSRNPIAVSPAASMRELARVFEEKKISGAPVVDAAGCIVGVVSTTDLIRRTVQGDGKDNLPPAYLYEIIREHAGQKPWENIPESLVCVSDIMTADPVTVSPMTKAVTVAQRMFERRIHRVVVVDDASRPIGIITSLDLLGVFSRD